MSNKRISAGITETVIFWIVVLGGLVGVLSQCSVTVETAPSFQTGQQATSIPDMTFEDTCINDRVYRSFYTNGSVTNTEQLLEFTGRPRTCYTEQRLRIRWGTIPK